MAAITANDIKVLRKALKVINAGVSKKGNAYDAFVCVKSFESSSDEDFVDVVRRLIAGEITAE